MTRSRAARLLRLPLLLMLGAAFAFAAGCGGGDDSIDVPEGFESVSPDQLTGKTFNSTEVDGHDLVPDTTITISFGPDFLSASAGCNSINGKYTFDDGLMKLGDGPRTLIGCPDERQKQDDWLTEVLTFGVRPYSSGEKLVLLGEDVAIHMEEGTVPGSPPPVIGTTWELNSYDSAGTVNSVKQGVRLPFLKFSENGRVELFDGCNSGGGKARVRDDGFIVFGPLALTRKACPGLTGEVSKAFLDVIDGKGAYAFEQQNLVISRQGQSLTFTPG